MSTVRPLRMVLINDSGLHSIIHYNKGGHTINELQHGHGPRAASCVRCPFTMHVCLLCVGAYPAAHLSMIQHEPDSFTPGPCHYGYNIVLVLFIVANTFNHSLSHDVVIIKSGTEVLATPMTSKWFLNILRNHTHESSSLLTLQHAKGNYYSVSTNARMKNCL